MIELFTSETPNGRKIAIMLQEINYEYKIKYVSLGKGDQFKDDFIKISPFSKIPVIIDTENSETIFGSGAILIYLAEKSGKFYDKKHKIKIDQWLMAQMGLIGPLIGQYHHYHHFNSGKSDYSEKRYAEISEKIYMNLDKRLSESKYLACENYTIADIATWPWIARHEWHEFGLKNYKNLSSWYENIASRPAVIKAYDFMGKGQKIPKP